MLLTETSLLRYESNRSIRSIYFDFQKGKEGTIILKRVGVVYLRIYNMCGKRRIFLVYPILLITDKYRQV